MYRFLILFLCLTFSAFSQTTKQVQAYFSDTKIKIDGVFDENIWQNTTKAKDFVMFRPGDGGPEPKNQKTEVKIAYTEKAIYFACTLYDSEIEKAPKQLLGRDQFGNADFFGVILNPSGDNINDFEFFVQITGNQGDAFVNPTSGEDFSWNAVWESAVTTHKDRWQIEYRIPYSALRFSNEGTQNWKINFHRQIRAKREQYSWSYIDRSKGEIGQYHGEIIGIKNIKPPLRLSLFPFTSAYYSEKNGDRESQLKLGLDLKYGISENFTLDMTIIPDFGQVGFDNTVLNLGPFEQIYNDQRPFFTEGTELFNKGNLLYSRRIGGDNIVSIDTEDLKEAEEFEENPSKSKVLNAFKITGRTKNGIGIGVLNAVTGNTYADIKNKKTGTKRKTLLNPLSLYNMVSIDKQLKNSSSITLLNTLVLREGHFKDAQVGSLWWYLNSNSRKYNLNGHLTRSFVNQAEDKIGWDGDIELVKLADEWKFNLGYDFSSKEYDINDFGYNFQTNIQSIYGSINYRILKPTKNFNSGSISYWYNVEALLKEQENPLDINHKRGIFTALNTGINANFTSKKFHSYGFGFNTTPFGNYDYFDTQLQGAYIRYKPFINTSFWVSPDYRKKLAIDFRGGYNEQLQMPFRNNGFNARIAPRWQPNDRWLIIPSFTYNRIYNDLGWVDKKTNTAGTPEVYFGKRHRTNITSTLNISYNINPKNTFNLNLRHYNSKADYYDNDFFLLQGNGALKKSDFDLEDTDPNINYTVYNFDLRYQWNFAPGSFLTLLYRNNITHSDKIASEDYLRSLNQVKWEELQHIFSINLVYYLDYQSIF
ncbi:MAG: carbohydrate binding family 9 domain-containing protein [Flavobacteriales bacterium]|jgi:hypothetical protein|nr:carbohydrate binding family 9 domain-containing protein [Flavobacteriales bacterium]